MNSRKKSIDAVLNKSIFPFVRSNIFPDPENGILDDDVYHFDMLLVDFDAWSTKQDQHVREKFRTGRVSQKQRLEALGGMLRLQVSHNLLTNDEDVVQLKRDSHKRLSCLHWEDILAQIPGQ